MAEQNSLQLNESNNIQGQSFKESISYSRLAEEVDRQDTDKEKSKEKPAPEPQTLLNPNQKLKNPPVPLKPQERQESRATEDGLKIQINYLSKEVEKSYQKDCKNQKISNTISNYMYSSSPSCNIPDAKAFISSQLGPIPQTQTEHKRSDEEPNEQKTIVESEVHNSNKMGSLYSFINNKNSLALQKNLMHHNKSINQSQPNDCTKRQLDDSVELVVGENHHETEKFKLEEQNPIKTSKAKTNKQSDKRYHTSFTTASKLLAKKEDFTNVMVQTVQKVQAALMTMSLKSPRSPDNNLNIRHMQTERPFIQLQQKQKKVQDIRAEERSNLLKQSKSLSKLKKSTERFSTNSKQTSALSKELQKIIRSSAWIKLLSSRANFNEQLNNCLIFIGKLLNISQSYTALSLNPFLVVYASNEILQISYSKKIYIGQYKQYKGGFVRHGKGIEIDPLRSIYRGNFKEGIKEGNGRILILESYTYDGQWKGGVMEGRGVLNTKGKSTYQGQFMNGKKHGFGTQELNSGDKYEGEFQNNAFHGKGFYSWRSGARYKGDFMNGQVHGQGKWISERGDLYEGSFINGKKEGHGVYAWKNGNKYEGEFKNGSRKNLISSKFSTQREVCDISFEKRSLSPKRFKIYF